MLVQMPMIVPIAAGDYAFNFEFPAYGSLRERPFLEGLFKLCRADAFERREFSACSRVREGPAGEEKTGQGRRVNVRSMMKEISKSRM